MLADSNYTTLKLATDGRGVAHLTLAKPETLNAFDETMIAELSDVFEVLSNSNDTRVVVLGAEGRAFSAGADLRWMERASNNSQQANLADARRFARMMQLLS